MNASATSPQRAKVFVRGRLYKEGRPFVCCIRQRISKRIHQNKQKPPNVQVALLSATKHKRKRAAKKGFLNPCKEMNFKPIAELRPPYTSVQTNATTSVYIYGCVCIFV